MMGINFVQSSYEIDLADIIGIDGHFTQGSYRIDLVYIIGIDGHFTQAMAIFC